MYYNIKEGNIWKTSKILIPSNFRNGITVYNGIGGNPKISHVTSADTSHTEHIRHLVIILSGTSNNSFIRSCFSPTSPLFSVFPFFPLVSA